MQKNHPYMHHKLADDELYFGSIFSPWGYILVELYFKFLL